MRARILLLLAFILGSLATSVVVDCKKQCAEFNFDPRSFCKATYQVSLVTLKNKCECFLYGFPKKTTTTATTKAPTEEPPTDAPSK